MPTSYMSTIYLEKSAETYVIRSAAVVTIVGIWEQDRHRVPVLLGRDGAPTDAVPHIEPSIQSTDQTGVVNANESPPTLQKESLHTLPQVYQVRSALRRD